MNANDKYRNYSATDIHKYLQGDLSAREMQALEAAALEDPFLADALEGMEKDRQLRGETAFRDDMASLKERLDLRTAEKKDGLVLPLYRSMWKFAAAFIILAAVGALAYRYVLNGRSSTPALASAGAEKKTVTDRKTDRFSSAEAVPGNAKTADPGRSANPAITNKDDDTTALSQHTDPFKSSFSRKASAPEKTTTRANAGDRSQAPALQAVRIPPAPGTQMLVTTDSPVAPYRGNKFERARSGTAANQFLTGKVTDDNNNPIPLITISFKNHQQAVRTDDKGQFRVQMLGSDSSTKHLIISSVGYQPVTLPVGALSDRSIDGEVAANTIRLQPQNNLLANNAPADPATGYGAKKATVAKEGFAIPSDKESAITAASKNMVQQANPASGWTAYKTYLEKNKWASGIDSTKKGMEAISFKVNKKGKLSSFKVDRSISPAHDALLLFLIHHGSPWKPVNGKSGDVTVILSY